MIRRNKTTTAAVDIVTAVQEQTAQAAALASIAGQDQLADPRLNPATRPHADRLRTAQQVKALDAEHARALRRDRVMDARASEAERTLEAIALARRTSSPARSVLALHTGRRTWSRLSIAASVVLAAGSAMGVEAAAQHLSAPTGTGYIAEVGLTGLATAAITYRAHLAEHQGELVKGSWQSRSLWVLMVLPLLVSVTANVATGNALGAACSIGAAAFALLGAVVADRSSAAMQARATEVDATDEVELRAVAMGEDSPAGPAETEAAAQEQAEEDRPDPVTEAAAVGVVELEAWLAESGGPDDGEDDGEDDGDGGAPPEPSPEDGNGPGGAAADLDRQGGHIVGDRAGRGGHIDSDQGGRSDGATRILPAAQARRAVGASTRHRVASFLADHPNATQDQIAAALGLSKATVKRHRRELRGGDR